MLEKGGVVMRAKIRTENIMVFVEVGMPAMLVLAIFIEEFLLDVSTFSFLAGHEIQQTKNNQSIIFDPSKITQSFIQFLELKLPIFNRQIPTHKCMVLIHVNNPKTGRLELRLYWNEE